ncbi:ataxin-1 [Anabrus simplex]|uniref:ataxin-1 n=1 Tax=Anabrus simplex TaxID=316456 RepID=UPI0035A261EA
MLSASLVVEGHSHGLGPGHHPGVFGEQFLLPGPKTSSGPQEFARPLPKPAPIVPRYNGSTLNGCRVVPSSRVSAGAVNLVQHKEENGDESPSTFPAPTAYTARPYPLPYPSFYPGMQGPYGSLHPGHYTPLLSRASYVPPLDTYRHSPPQPVPFSSAYSPPTSSTGLVKPGQSLLIRERRPFKVPSGKEGSLKHRILTRPPVSAAQAAQVAAQVAAANDAATAAASSKRRVTAGTTHPALPPNFTKGSLIQLASGELRRVEDMRTEDFVSSAEKSPALRLDPSTVVRIEQDETRGTATLTLSYGETRTQVEFESSLEHPFFVYGQGWASCSPERTLQCYGLKCHRLQVGDICISLTPRPNSSSKERLPRKRRWSAPDHFLKDGEEVAPPNTVRRLHE